MPALSSDRIATLLTPFLCQVHPPPPSTLFGQLSTYLDHLLKWNARTNLTAVHEPEAIVTRHFGESLFLATHLPEHVHTVLDLGSGAGFPGLPLHILRPDLAVTLAESQGKKSAFLREVIRSLDLTTQVHAARAETLLNMQRFDAVTLRAVDNMPLALNLAADLAPLTLVLTTIAATETWTKPFTRLALPQSSNSILAMM
jgi:16S rRNA (guanine527-N7)-methyltransferase